MWAFDAEGCILCATESKVATVRGAQATLFIVLAEIIAHELDCFPSHANEKRPGDQGVGMFHPSLCHSCQPLKEICTPLLEAEACFTHALDALQMRDASALEKTLHS